MLSCMYLLLLLFTSISLHPQSNEQGQPHGLAVSEAIRDARYARMQQGEVLRMQAGVQGTWREVGSSNQAGRVVDAEYDHTTGRVWLAGAGGTIWGGDTSGAKWKCYSDARSVSNPLLLKFIRIADGGERLVVVSDTSGVWLFDIANNVWSQADGLTDLRKTGSFSHAVTLKREGRIEILVVGKERDNARRAVRNVLYRSIDGGASFQRLLYFDLYWHLWTDGEQEAWLFYGTALRKIQTDGTLSETDANPLADYWTSWGYDRSLQGAVFAGADLGSVIMAATRSDSTRFYETTDGGVTWSIVSELPFRPLGVRSFAQAYEDGSYIFGGTDAYRSTDDCRTWTKVNSSEEYYSDVASKLHADITAVRSFPQEVTFICTGGAAYITRSGAKLVRNITLNNLNIGRYYGTYTNRITPSTVYAGSQDQGLQRSQVDEGGVRPFQQMMPGTYSRLVSGDGGTTLFCVKPGSVIIIPETEKEWLPVAHRLQLGYGLELPPLAVRSSMPKTVFLGGGARSNCIFTYSFNGAELIEDSVNQAFTGKISALAFAPSDDRVGYALTSANTSYRTTDGGSTWHAYNLFWLDPGPQGYALAIDPQDAGRYAIGGIGLGNYPQENVYLSQINGPRILIGLPPCNVNSLAFSADGHHLAAATDAGAFIYHTTNNEWTDITELGSPDQVYMHVEYVEPLGLFRFSTYGRGIWDFTVTGTTDVQEGIVERPRLTAIGQLVNGVSSIAITSDRETDATIVWYDMSGKRYGEDRIHIHQGTKVQEVPSDARRHGARTCVITTSDGTVSAALAP